MTSILIVDDHPIVRQGLRSLLSNYQEFEVVGEAADVDNALHLVEQLRPDVTLVDIRLGAGSSSGAGAGAGPRSGAGTGAGTGAGAGAGAGAGTGAGTGLDLVDAVLERDPTARVLVVSSFDDEEYVTRSLRAGALGYVLKADSPSTLVGAIQSVAARERALSPRVTSHLVEQLLGEAGAPDAPGLDALERRMLGMLSRGLSNGQIAEELYMSDTTVKRRLRVLFGKLGVSRRTEAVGVAARRGLI